MPHAPESPARVLAREAPRHVRLAAGGVIGGERVTWTGEPGGPFQIGSVTKVFTSLVLRRTPSTGGCGSTSGWAT